MCIHCFSLEKTRLYFFALQKSLHDDLFTKHVIIYDLKKVGKFPVTYS